MKESPPQNSSRFYTICDTGRNGLLKPQPISYTSSNSEKGENQNNPTLHCNFNNIKLPKNVQQNEQNITNPFDYMNDSTFSFEKDRIKVLGLEKISKFNTEGPSADVDLGDPRVAKFQTDYKNQLEKYKVDVQKWSIFLKILSFATCMIEILSATTSLIFIFIFAISTNSDIVACSIPLIINIFCSLWMLNISIKSSSLSGVRIFDNLIFRKYFIITGITTGCALLQFIIMAGVKSTPEMLNKLPEINTPDSDPHADSKKAAAYSGLVYLTVWMFSVFNFTICALYIVLAILLRFSLEKQEIKTLEQNTLPLGYLMHTKRNTICQQSTAIEIKL